MMRPRDEGAPLAPRPPLPERLAPGSTGILSYHGDCCSPASEGEDTGDDGVRMGDGARTKEQEMG